MVRLSIHLPKREVLDAHCRYKPTQAGRKCKGRYGLLVQLWKFQDICSSQNGLLKVFSADTVCCCLACSVLDRGELCIWADLERPVRLVTRVS